MRIAGEKILRATVNIGEVAASAAGDQNFLAAAVGVLENGDAPPALPRFDGAH